MSEFIRSKKTIGLAVAAGITAGSAIFVSNLSTSHKDKIENAKAVAAYIASPERNQRLASVVTKLGKEIVYASENLSNPWGGFDAFCANDNKPFSSQEGWVSQGFKPEAGDICWVQHDPQFGGLQGMNITAYVLMGRDGHYTNDFTGDAIFTNNCDNVVVVRSDSNPKLWEATYQQDNGALVLDAQNAPTLKQAEAIDAYDYNCLSSAGHDN